MSRYKRFVQDRYQEGLIVPAWKGYVASDFIRREVIVAPIGFNLVFNFLHGVWLWTRCYKNDCYDFRAKQLRLRKRITKIGE